MATRENVLKAIDLVIGECMASQEKSPDVVVAREISALKEIRLSVQTQWPLPEEVKANIIIGPVAAKNLSDWNDHLASSLMILHHVLKHDGDSLHKLLGQPI